MIPEQVMVGTIVFLVLGVLACGYFSWHIGANSNGKNVDANRWIMINVVIICTVSMWLAWACCYMHQVYPIITPILEMHAKE